MKAARIHPGYGRMQAADFIPLHIDEWLRAHKTWKGSKTYQDSGRQEGVQLRQEKWTDLREQNQQVPGPPCPQPGHLHYPGARGDLRGGRERGDGDGN